MASLQVLFIWTDNVMTEEQTLTNQQAIDLAVQYHNAGDVPKAESIINKYFKLILINLSSYTYLAWLLIRLEKTMLPLNL